MMCDIYYGKISKETSDTWGLDNNPYHILEERCLVRKIGGWDFLSKAKEIFEDEYQVDWGSYVYRCTREQLLELQKQTNCVLESFDKFDENCLYAIVFIEQP